MSSPGDRSAQPPFINLCGDYRFLRGGYWALVDAELAGVRSRPSPVEAVTAQNAAACLITAEQAGLSTPSWRVARKPEHVQAPCLLVPVAGLTDASYQVNAQRAAASQWRRASQNGTRPVLAVEHRGRLSRLHSVMGLTTHRRFELAWEVWRVFGVPLATVWFYEAPRDAEGSQAEGPARFLGLDPLPLRELPSRELRLLEEVSKRPMSL